jgi:hypothetical protein
MAFTSADLTIVEDAIRDLAAGKRLVSFDVGGKSRSFQAASIQNLLIFRDQVKSDISAAAGGGIFNQTALKGPS